MQDVSDHERQTSSVQPLAGARKSQGRWDMYRLPIFYIVSVTHPFKICVGFGSIRADLKEDHVQARECFSV